MRIQRLYLVIQRQVFILKKYDVIVIGGGPAGLAAAISAKKENSNVLLIEREGRLGGILKQCIHDGFGLVRFGEKLSGPEYAERFIEEFHSLKIDYEVLTFVTDIKKLDNGFEVTVVNKEGVISYETKAIVLSTGCRERTSKQVSIHGTRPSGVFTAGTAQYFTNILGEMPTRKCVILGSGDIGLIMARRLTLEGAKVCGVYEAKSSPSGLTRNIMQCLTDFDIPLYLSKTVTRIFGQDRLEAVEISKVDEKMKPIAGTEEIIECDALILSVGLIPENELAENLGVVLDLKTKGPICDERFMTSVPGVFSCGNALHVNDLVDYVSESGEIAGRSAAHYEKEKKETASLNISPNFLYMVPQKVHVCSEEELILYFRTRDVMNQAVFSIKIDGNTVFEKKYSNLKPPEMERLVLNFSSFGIKPDSKIEVEVQ